MNYFRVHTLLLAGVQPVPVQVECVHSRRLPFLQIFGAPASVCAEMRERVLAAIASLEDGKLRLPSRRITVQIQPALRRQPAQALDLAVALAVLGSAARFPPGALEGVLVSGELGLDGGLRGQEGLAGLFLRARRELGFRDAILPVAWGGGFRSLAEVLRFLRGEAGAGRADLESEERSAPPGSRAWDQLSGWGLGQRIAQLAAAGRHHLLLSGVPAERSLSLAHAISALLPELTKEEWQELHAIYSLAGVPGPSRPFHCFGSAPGLPPLLPEQNPSRMQELFLAHRGVLFVDRLLQQERLLFSGLLDPMTRGRLSVRFGRRTFEAALDPLVVARCAPCSCGRGPGKSCYCRPGESRRHREKIASARRLPFELELAGSELEARGATGESFSAREALVHAARAIAMDRQGKPNARLSEAELQARCSWTDEARLLGRHLSASLTGDPTGLARVAQTISDLRGSPRVEERDLLEARHYFAVEESGSREAIFSAPEQNSSATPKLRSPNPVSISSSRTTLP